MNILLHTCCAPCLIHPLEVLRLKGFNITGLFYNPNIHSFFEYNQRKDAIVNLNPGIDMIYPDYAPQEFFRLTNLKEEKQLRCAICWQLRLKKTASMARERGFKYFSTTLLVSPYQDHDVLKKIGNQAGDEEGVEFYYADFRTGFRKAQDEARKKVIYLQKYCGCIYSEMERAKERKKCVS
jgi:hypothetical protein